MSARRGPIAVSTDISMVEVAKDWLVVDKPAPLIVHPTNDRPEPTLLGEVKNWLSGRGEDYATLSILNRLDRETSGLVLMSRTKEAARRFGRAMERREVRKEYLAIVSGRPEWERQRVAEPILRKGEVGESRIWIKQVVHPDGKYAATDFEVVRRFENAHGYFAVVRARPETGRTHQIRVHLNTLGHPIVGDKIYGPSEDCYLEFIENGWNRRLENLLHLPRHALHASRLLIPDKTGGLDWSSSMPPALQKFCEIGSC